MGWWTAREVTQFASERLAIRVIPSDKIEVLAKTFCFTLRLFVRGNCTWQQTSLELFAKLSLNRIFMFTELKIEFVYCWNLVNHSSFWWLLYLEPVKQGNFFTSGFQSYFCSRHTTRHKFQKSPPGLYQITAYSDLDKKLSVRLCKLKLQALSNKQYFINRKYFVTVY